jgi:hypothetical protein
VPVDGILSGTLIVLSLEILRWRGIIRQMKLGVFMAFMIAACILGLIGLSLAISLLWS